MPSDAPPQSKISIDYFRQIEAKSLPVAPLLGIEVHGIGSGWAHATARYKQDFLRPGGTVSGPVMMALADYVAFAAVLSLIGPVELAVTSNLTINFLKKPLPGDLFAQADVMRLGRRLAYTDVHIYSGIDESTLIDWQHDKPQHQAPNSLAGGIHVAQASVIYAIPA